jgi:hypothetical protein
MWRALLVVKVYAIVELYQVALEVELGYAFDAAAIGLVVVGGR